MAREQYGWALEETRGRRKGGLVRTYTPSQFLVHTAIFTSRTHAQNFIRNANAEDAIKMVRVKVTIEKMGDKDEQ